MIKTLMEAGFGLVELGLNHSTEFPYAVSL